VTGHVCTVHNVRRFREADYALSKEECEAKLGQVAAARHECGGRLLGSAVARWSWYTMADGRFRAETCSAGGSG
jgi:hypothetical protein